MTEGRDEFWADTDVVGELMRNASYRQAPPKAAYDTVFRAAEAAWQQDLGRRRARRTRVLALAAGLVLAVSAGWWSWLQTGAGVDQPLARVTRIAGPIEFYRAADAQWLPLNTEAAIRLSLIAGQKLRTGQGDGLAIAIDDGVSLRLAGNTTFTLLSPHRVRLEGGQLYVDTGAQGRARRAVEVLTPAGSVIDIGTQFEVSYSPQLYRVRVREGQVEFAANGKIVQGSRGEQLSLVPGEDPGAPVARETIDTSDDSWRWVEALASSPSIDGRPLIELLNWVARETGRSLEFDSDATEQRAREIRLSGSLRDVVPLDALDTALATTELRARMLESGTIFIAPEN